jgi:cellulose synthase/poly-beta-1,6-N-acetylglucosamine synthase-like glycosyltransferase
MYMVREVMYCKPGKVRPLVEKFLSMSKLGEKVGMPRMRVMTDFCAERYWTVVAEMEVADLAELE